MRIRSIKPEFWRSKDITSLSRDDRLLFIGLWSYVDDNGVGRDVLSEIIGDLFAEDMLRDPRETVARVSEGLTRLKTARLIARYEANNMHYLHVTTWPRHQRVDKPAKPRYPAPDPHDSGQDALDDDTDRAQSRESRETVAPGTGEQGNRGTGEQNTSPDGEVRAQKRATRIPEPFIVNGDMRRWARDEVPAVDVNAATRMFVDHWRAASGRNATKKDWTATWRNWLRRDAQDLARRSRPREATPRQTKDDRALQTLRLGAEVQAAVDERDGSDYLDLKAIPA